MQHLEKPALDDRACDILREIVLAYVETGEAIGSRTLSRRLGLELSPATIRNVMADLQQFGLLFAPHASAGRLPTDAGLRLFVDGLLELGTLSRDDQAAIEARCTADGRSLQQLLEEATTVVSGLSNCAGLVLAPKREAPLRHIEFVPLSPGRALVVLIGDDGEVENRVVALPPGLPAASLVQAGNFLTARLIGRTLAEARDEVLRELDEHRAELDTLATRVAEAGLATWTGDADDGYLIVRGQSHLLDDVAEIEDLGRIRRLFETLETKEHMSRLLEAAQSADGVRIFIGGDNELFGLSGCATVVAPFRNTRQQIVGAIGVIGPTRINYARIVPMVDYTAQVIGRLMG